MTTIQGLSIRAALSRFGPAAFSLLPGLQAHRPTSRMGWAKIKDRTMSIERALVVLILVVLAIVVIERVL